MPPTRLLARGRKVVEKKFATLERLQIEYVCRKDIRPNPYNPNRQSDHDYELLCRSMEEDGFTQPVIVNDGSLAPGYKNTIVDGEHRWRAAAVVYGEDCEIPIVLAPFTEEQMRISTLRHNRARGSEDIELAADVLRDLQRLGALDHAVDSLMLDPVELDRLLTDVPVPEQLASPEFSEAWEPSSNADETGVVSAEAREVESGGQRAFVAASHAAVEAQRREEERLSQARTDQERQMIRHESTNYRVALLFAGEEAAIVKAVLGNQPAVRLLELCQREYAASLPIPRVGAVVPTPALNGADGAVDALDEDLEPEDG